ncbi:MAG: TonB-dependent receptor, partial [Bacteroidota bacterium]
DEGFIFNASHALGFFSTFNTDLISGVELYKGNIPAQFGGRLASVLDVQMRTGSFENWGIKGGVGPVSARFNFEGPIVKDKVALIGGFRSSYSDWILNQIKVREVQNSSAFFYDANLRVTTRLNDKNSLTLSGYATSDEFIYNNEFGFEYATMMGQLDFKTIFNEKTYNRFTVTASSYESAQIDLDSLDASRLDTEVSYIKAKEVLTYSTENGLKVDGGLMGIYYMSQPGTIQPNTLESTVVARGLEDEQAFEGAAFANVEWPVTSQFLISAGLRFNYYSFLGPKTVYQYGPDGPDPENLIDSIRFQSGESIASYNTLEPRVSMRYRLNENASIKAGYARTSQFINQIFNSDSPTPTSQFQLSTNYLPPFLSHNFSIGYFQNFKKNNWETSIETYGRVIDQLYDYKDFAQLVVNPQLETEILLGEGRAYGVELSIKKKKGLFNGWLSYTLSRTERMVEGINNGEWYPSNFDKPHDLSFILNYSPNNRHTITMKW